MIEENYSGIEKLEEIKATLLELQKEEKESVQLEKSLQKRMASKGNTSEWKVEQEDNRNAKLFV